MNFYSSTHRANWLFTKEQLASKRTELLQKCCEGGSRAATPAPGADQDAEPTSAAKRARDAPPVTVADEQKLLRYYEMRLAGICAELRFPKKMQATALVFFKRFYLGNSCLNTNVDRVMVTSVYLAAKIEEAYISAEELCKCVKMDSSVVLKMEVNVLQGLHFDLVVHSPYRALCGLLQDVQDQRQQQKEAAGAAQSSIDEGLASAPDDLILQCRAKAVVAVDQLMLTDAPLLFPPASIALAALRSGCRSRGIRIERFMNHLALQAVQAQQGPGVGPGSADVQQALQQLVQSLDEIDRLAVESMHRVEQQEVAEIDKRIKLWKASMAANDPNAAANKQAADADTAAKAAKREAKLREREAKKKAEEAALLGM